MDAVIYIRWSSTEQGKGSSLERQSEDCRRHAVKHGWKVLEELVDDGVSAFKGRHASVGELSRFVADVENGAYPDGVILLTEKLDRLSRESAKKAFAWMVHMTDLGVVVATVDSDRQYTRDNLDMQTIIEVIVKAQVANEESVKKSSRIARAWAIKRDRLDRGEKIVLTRRAPAWLTVVDQPARFQIVPERAAIVRRIFEETVAGFGKHHIARNLNRDGVVPFGRAEGWHASYIQKILRSPAVLGEFQPGSKPRGEARQAAGDVIPDYYPRVIEPDLHAMAMTSMKGRHRRVGGRGRRLVNLFSGLARCQGCHAPMTMRAKGRKSRADGSLVNEDYLICGNYQRGLGCSNGHHFNYALWESGILDAILLDALEDRHFAAPEALRPLEIEMAERKRKRASDKDRADTALALYIETQRPEVKASWIAIVEAVDEHDQVIADLERRLVKARGTVSPDEHRKRIFALRATLDAEDEDVRFATRARIKEATHELVRTMQFTLGHPAVEMVTHGGVVIDAVWEEWGDQKGVTVTKWASTDAHGKPAWPRGKTTQA
ncbi:recombinase family protein [Sphingomonas morindae]|uniref:Recombinase family protein n=1 Tax=Sphingomonas morindae TaxID=1541170 RepID=A0ABY4XAH3_9SPHN|nr:recombinase family protein [Sphingomonas morindae]USI73942.1 recombinase family protein [Sphingomonas morindae]